MLWGRKSRASRRQADAPAWIVVDRAFGVQRCKVVDISQSGAQIRVDNPSAVPTFFTLSFDQKDRLGQHCKVVWRSMSTLGVQFVN